MGHWLYDGKSFKHYDDDFDKVFYKNLKNYINEFFMKLADSDYNGDFPYNINIFTMVRRDLSILDDMYSNSDKRFIYKFCRESYKINDSKQSIFYKNVFGNKNFNSYILNLHIILLAYKYNKDNYENFEKIVEGIANIQIDICFLKEFPNWTQLAKFDEIVKFILEFKEYKNMPNLRNYFCLNFFLFDGKEELYNDILKIYKDSMELNVERSKMIDIIEKVLGNDLSIKYYYSKILLYENRFDYFNEKINEVENNRSIRNGICLIDLLSINLFNELNKDNDKDSFIVLMDKVFDSDSYFEFNSKMLCLIDASKSFESGDKIRSFSYLKDLDSDKHKSVYCDKKVSYPRNTMNVIDKPKTILERMKYLYSRIDNSFSYDFMDEIHNDSISVIDFYERISKKIKREKGFVKKIGRLFHK